MANDLVCLATIGGVDAAGAHFEVDGAAEAGSFLLFQSDSSEALLYVEFRTAQALLLNRQFNGDWGDGVEVACTAAAPGEVQRFHFAFGQEGVELHCQGVLIAVFPFATSEANLSTVWGNGKWANASFMANAAVPRDYANLDADRFAATTRDVAIVASRHAAVIAGWALDHHEHVVAVAPTAAARARILRDQNAAIAAGRLIVVPGAPMPIGESTPIIHWNAARPDQWQLRAVKGMNRQASVTGVDLIELRRRYRSKAPILVDADNLLMLDLGDSAVLSVGDIAAAVQQQQPAALLLTPPDSGLSVWLEMSVRGIARISEAMRAEEPAEVMGLAIMGRALQLSAERA